MRRWRCAVDHDAFELVVDKPDFRRALAQMMGREVYKTIRASGESA